MENTNSPFIKKESQVDYSVYEPQNAGFVTAKVALLKIVTFGIQWRILPAEEADVIFQELIRGGVGCAIWRANDVRILERFVYAEGGKVPEPEYVDVDRSSWRPVATWPHTAKGGHARLGSLLLHNKKIAYHMSGCRNCGTDTRFVRYCHTDRRYWRFCNEGCLVKYSNKRKGHGNR